MSYRYFSLPRWAGFAAAWLIVAGLSLLPLLARGQSGSVGSSAAQTEAFVEEFHAHLARVLSVSSDQEIDADLRSAATAMVAKELPRIKQVLTAWAAEDQRDRTLGESFMALQSRTFNEMGLWLLDRDGPEHDRILQKAYAKPRSCDFVRPRATFFGMVVQAWQQVPREQRASLLAAEARLLSRWGTRRPTAPARPSESVSDRAFKVFARHVERGTPLTHPLPPISAFRLFSETDRESDRDRPETERRCLARQWDLQGALARSKGVLGDAEWTAYLYDRIPDARYWFNLDRDDEAKADDYPEAASKLRVEGEVVVEFAIDADGKALDTRIAQRDVTAFGIEGQRPVVFETLLDEASLRRVRAMTINPASATQATDGRRLLRMPFGYSLK